MWGRDKGIEYDLGRRGRNNVMKIIITYTIISIFLGKGGHVNASIHEYMNDGFIPRFNSFFFHGGSEGLFASKPPPPHHQHPSSDDKSLNGKSFIRYFNLIIIIYSYILHILLPFWVSSLRFFSGKTPLILCLFSLPRVSILSEMQIISWGMAIIC